MVAAVHVGLHHGEVLRVAQVGLEDRAHRRQRPEEPREGGLVGPDQRVLGGDDVERHLARVGVDDDLDGVAHVVVGPGQPAPLGEDVRHGRLAVGEVVARRVGVDDPVDLAADDDRVRVRVDGEERQRLFDAGLDVGDVDEPRLAGDEVGDQQVQVPQVDREGEPVQEPPDRDPAATVAVALDVRPVRRLVLDLGLFGVDDHVLAVTRHVVDGGMADDERRRLRRLRDGAGEEVRQVARVGDVAGGGDHAVAVRVLQVRVHPALLGEPARVEGAHADEDRRGLAVDRVAVDGGE